MNYKRIRRLIEEAIERLQLDLKGYTVYTEAGTGLFAVTPVIAILAGAEKVFTISKDTSYGSAEDAFFEVREILNNEKLSKKIVKTSKINQNHLYETDILTNLGHVRPIDKSLINKLNSNKVVIPYMCEAWEIRLGDVDLSYCFKKNIPVMGTNEEHPSVNCFDSCGILAVKLLLEAGLEIKGNKIAIYSQDKFGKVIFSAIRLLGADVRIFDEVSELINNEWFRQLDALIISDYMSTHQIIGIDGIIDLEVILNNSPNVVLIPFAGAFDKEYVDSFNIQVYPNESLPSTRMIRTLAYLGAKPTIDLLAGGLKVGQIMRNIKETNNSANKVMEISRNIVDYKGLAQRIDI